jgi:hypothetical protein
MKAAIDGLVEISLQDGADEYARQPPKPEL